MLEALREAERRARPDLRRELFERYAQEDDSEDVWRSTTVQPVLRVAAR